MKRGLLVSHEYVGHSGQSSQISKVVKYNFPLGGGPMGVGISYERGTPVDTDPETSTSTLNPCKEDAV